MEQAFFFFIPKYSTLVVSGSACKKNLATAIHKGSFFQMFRGPGLTRSDLWKTGQLKQKSKVDSPVQQ